MIKTALITDDEVFSRALFLELSDICDITLCKDDMPDGTELAIIDADSHGGARCRCARIYFTAGNADVDAGGECRFIRRPFDIEELRNMIAGITAADSPDRGSRTGIAVKNGKLLYNGETVQLTETEFAVFKELYDNKGTVVGRAVIKEIIKRKENAAETNSGDVYIRMIRKKLDEAYNVRIIKTARGKGYYID